MQIQDMVVFVTGVNWRLGRALACAALALLAKKAYSAVRDRARVLLFGVQTMRLDVTRADGADAARAEFATNFYGSWRMGQAFAPALSALPWFHLPGGSTNCTSTSAALTLTNAFRNELRALRAQKVGLHVGFMDADLTTGVNAPKVGTDDLALQMLRPLVVGRQ